MRQAVARAGDQAEELGHAVEEVEDLRDQQQDQGLGEVAKDGDHDEDHASKVAVRIAHKHACRVFVLHPKRQGDAQEGQEEVEREQVRVGRRVRVRGDQVERIIKGQQKGDDNGLRDLDAIDARQDIDTIRAEDAKGGHVGIVEEAQVEQLAAGVGL